MPVSTTNAISGPLLTNGLTTTFPFTFTAPSADEVQVISRNIATGVDTIVSPSLYSVTLTTGGGGSVVFSVAPASGAELYLLLNPDFTQDVEFYEGAKIAAPSLNRAADRGAARDQFLRHETERALKVEIGAEPPVLGGTAEGQALVRRGGKLTGVSLTTLAEELAAASVAAVADQLADDLAASEAARDLSEAWAEGTLPGGPGTKSAKEWAGDVQGEADRAQGFADEAAASAASASTARTQAELAAQVASANGQFVTTLTTPVPPDGTIEVLLIEPGALAYQVQAGAWVAIGWLGEILFQNVTALRAWNPAVAPAVGTIIRTRNGGFAYEVAPSSATNHQITTAGGIKLLVLRDSADKLPARALPVDSSASLQSAISAGQNVINLPNGTVNLASEVLVPQNVSLIGPNVGTCVINYTGTGTALRVAHSDGLGTRIYDTEMAGFRIITSTGAVGIDIDSLSEGDFREIIVAGFGTGIALHSGISGGAVYNRFQNVKAQSCDVGFDLYRAPGGLSSYTNDNIFYACRANICSVVGWRVTGGNHNVWHAGQIEVCGIGALIEEPATATTQRNQIVSTRFENNTTDVQIGTGVTETLLGPENWYVNGQLINDSGSRSQLIGVGPAQHRRSSGFQIPGGSFRYIRTANGGSEVPHTVLHEASSLNSPVTLEIQNGATSENARAFRVRYGGDAGTLKFGIVPESGKITDLSTTNGPTGGFTLSAAANTTVANRAVSAASRIFIQPANPSACALIASKGLYVVTRNAGTSFVVRTGDNTPAVGGETFWFWMVN